MSSLPAKKCCHVLLMYISREQLLPPSHPPSHSLPVRLSPSPRLEKKR